MNRLMRIRALMLVTVLVATGQWSLAEESRIFTQEELTHDVRELASNLEDAHPDPYTSGGGKIAFQKSLQNILAEIPAGGMNSEQFYRLLLPFVASLRDGHTALLAPDGDSAPGPGLPLNFKIIDENLAVAGATCKENTNLSGALLLSVEGVPVRELVERQNALRGIENIYGTLALLTRSLGSQRGLQILLPGRDPGSQTRVALRTSDGQTREFIFEPGEVTDCPVSERNSVVELPDMSDSDVAWTFLDKDRKIALLKIDDMSSYREASEDWIASDMSEGLNMAGAAYQKFHGTPVPEDVSDILAGLPSATDVFVDLVVEMKRAGTANLIVDLRENTGGNDLMVEMLLYFLFGQQTMASYDTGFQISRYSDLYFQVYGNDSLALINRDRAVPLQVGDYDFSEQQAWEQSSTVTTPPDELVERLKSTPTFFDVFRQERYEAYYRPENLVVLSSAWTYSSGFSMLAALDELGATVIGTPSAHAGNNFGDSLLFRLANTQLMGAVSFKQNVRFPGNPEKGRCLRPDVVLTHEKWAELDFDPDAEVLLALEFLQDHDEAD